MKETPDQRDARLWQEADDAAVDIALVILADEQGANPQPIADILYDRLERLGAYDLARLVTLLVHRHGNVEQRARMLQRVPDAEEVQQL